MKLEIADRFAAWQLQIRSETFYCILASILPFTFICLWMLANKQLPTADATDYLLTGHKIYHHFTDNGFWHGILHFEIERGWRPIFFSVLTVPFLLMSHGDVWVAYHGLAIILIMASARYVYLLLRLKLDPLSAIISTNLICILPFVADPILTFYAESALFPAVLGSLYHLIQSDFLCNKAQSILFVIFTSLAILVRPVEAVTDLALIFCLLFAIGWYQTIFSIKQVLQIFMMSVSAIFLMILITAMYFIHHYPFKPIDGGFYDIQLAKTIYKSIFISLASFASVAALFTTINLTSKMSPSKKYESYIVQSFAAIICISLLWYLPYAFKTYLWFFRTSMGDLAVTTANTLGNNSYLMILKNLIIQAGILPISIISMVFLLSLVSMCKEKRIDLFLSKLFVYLLLVTPFSIWEILNTVQSAPRKISLTFAIFLMVFLVVGLQRIKWWTLKISIITTLLIVQFGYVISIIYPSILEKRIVAFYLGMYPTPVKIQSNPHDEVIKFLNMQQQRYGFVQVSAEVNPETILPVDPFLLTLMSKVQNQAYVVSYPYFNSYSEKNSYSLTEGNTAVFLTGKKDEMLVSEQAARRYHEFFINEKNPTLKTRYHFLYYYAQNQLDNIGWKVGPCINIVGRDQNEYLGCLLLAN